jgi:acylphosphatase
MSEQKQKKKAVHLIVHGHVQGVGFRYFTRQNANRLGLKGWVQNQYDGTVEVWAEGYEAGLRKLIQRVREGPSHARVDRVEVEWKEPKGEYNSFGTRY